MKFATRLILITAIFLSVTLSGQITHDSPSDEARLQPYLEFLQNEGRDPLAFCLEKLQTFDLLIFDDGWHPAVEPFELYQELIAHPEFIRQAKYVFLEVVPVNKQDHLDRYFDAPQEDQTLLYPVFQDDFSGYGWPLKTYFDLFAKIYEVNQALPAEARIRVIGCNSPTYWQEIRTAEDVALFRKSLIGNDYTMYRIMLQDLANFEEDRKGIFLTNTRHAYKGIKNRQGQYFWNCGTFFHQWHPGKTYSIRFHHLMLNISGEKNPDEQAAKSTAGTERLIYRWSRMENGLWDSAFAANNNQPVAVPLKDSPFGKTAYVGNHMHRAAAGQSMHDANDAIIFLKPLEELHLSAEITDIYDPNFRLDLQRRYRILLTAEQLSAKLKEEAVNSLAELIDKTCMAMPQRKIEAVENLEAIDAWKSAGATP